MKKAVIVYHRVDYDGLFSCLIAKKRLEEDTEIGEIKLIGHNYSDPIPNLESEDADYIIYNSTIEGELSSVDDLLAKSLLFEKFKAVQEGHVYCTSKNLYQSTMSLGTITSDIRRMLTGDDADLTYIYKLE